MSYQLGKTSNLRLDSCHPDLQRIVREGISNAPYDFGVAFGWRSPEAQDELYAQGRTEPGPIVTNVRGGQSKHNHMLGDEPCSLAVDIYHWDGKQARWGTREHWQIMRFLQGVAVGLGIDVRMGMDWESFTDVPHIELKGEKT